MLSSLLTAVLATALPALASTLCIGDHQPAGPFTGYAMTRDYHANPIKYYSLIARDGHFEFGRNRTAYSCPGYSPLPYVCPDDKIIAPYESEGNVYRHPALLFADGGLSLAVSAPGGQKVYMEPDGALAYLPANHTGPLPANGTYIEFDVLPKLDGQEGPTALVAGWDNLVACPRATDPHSYFPFPYVVYVAIPSTNAFNQLDECVPFMLVLSKGVDGGTENGTEISVPFQYDV